jgi:hypothetical protein
MIHTKQVFILLHNSYYTYNNLENNLGYLFVLDGILSSV